MITDEMIRVAKECLPAEVTGNIHSALESAYPLIRARVLEEAAALCDAQEIRKSRSIEDDCFNSGCDSCALAIREEAKS